MTVTWRLTPMNARMHRDTHADALQHVDARTSWSSFSPKCMCAYTVMAQYWVKCYSKAQQDFPIKSSRKINREPTGSSIVETAQETDIITVSRTRRRYLSSFTHNEILIRLKFNRKAQLLLARSNCYRVLLLLISKGPTFPWSSVWIMFLYLVAWQKAVNRDKDSFPKEELKFWIGFLPQSADQNVLSLEKYQWLSGWNQRKTMSLL